MARSPLAVAVGLLRLSPLLLAAPMLSGCVLTHVLWGQAGVTSLAQPSAAGVLEPSPHHEGGTAPTRLVVGYTGHGPEWPVSAPFTLPLDGRGAAPYPFGYAGVRRTPAGVVADLPAAQREALLRARLEVAPGKADDYARASAGQGSPPGFRPFPLQAAGAPPSYGRWKSGGLYVIALRAAPRGGVEVVRSSGHGDDAPLPAECHIVLLPPTQPRPAKDAAGATAGAILLTPLALAADVVYTPIYFILLLTGAASR